MSNTRSSGMWKVEIKVIEDGNIENSKYKTINNDTIREHYLQ